MMFAAGIPLVRVRFCGNTLSTVGAAPKLHCRVAPAQTCGQPMPSSRARWRCSRIDPVSYTHLDVYKRQTPAFDERLRKVLLQTFRPAFLARMTVVPYRPLEEATLEGIVVAKLEKLRERYKAATGKQFDFDPAIVKACLLYTSRWRPCR